ncbi:MAG: MFS transporter [Actinomycetota bacterium]|nr:MFS transporter [Actinomycetota bacterium]
MTDSITQPRTTAEPTDEAPLQAPRGIVLAVLLAAYFMAQFDFFVVNVAAPALRQDLGVGDGALELVVGGYAFAYAGGLVTGGRLGDIFGHRRVFVSGMIGFALTSLLCGLSVNPLELVIARLAQGTAAAAMLPQVLALIKAAFPTAFQPKAMAWYGVTAGLGAVCGQALGGLLVSADIGGLSWRPIFLVNVPIGAVVAVLAGRMLPAHQPAQQRPGLDPIGAAGIAATVALVLVPLSLGRSEHWPVWTAVCLIASVPAGLLTLRWQRTLTRTGASPTLNMSLFRHRSFSAGLLANVSFMLYFGSYMFTLSLLLQAGLGLSAFGAGLIFTPAALAFSTTAFLGRKIIARYGLRAAVLASLVSAAGLGLLAVRTQTAGLHTGLPWIVAATMLISAGAGVVLPSLIGSALIDITPRQAGAAAGMLTAGQQFASSIGVAIIGTVFFTVADHHPGPAGYPAGMTWAAVIDIVLLFLVAGSILLLKKDAATKAAGH